MSLNVNNILKKLARQISIQRIQIIKVFQGNLFADVRNSLYIRCETKFDVVSILFKFILYALFSRAV